MFELLLTSIYSDANTLTFGGFMICLIGSLLLGTVIAFESMYKSSHSRSFLVSLVILPPIVQTIIAVVNGQLGAGIAVAGAFSLVRFRSVPASAREITSIFLAMAVGLAMGMGYIGVSVIVTAVVILVDMLLAATGFGNSKRGERVLRITIPESLNYTEVFDELFADYTAKSELVKVKTTNMGSLFKLEYRIILKDVSKEKELIDEIRCRNGNLEISCCLPETIKNEI